MAVKMVYKEHKIIKFSDVKKHIFS